MFETCELLGCTIEAVETAPGRAEPEGAGVVFQNDKNLVIPQRSRIQRIVLEGRHAVAVKPEQPVLRAEPHEALVILQDAQD